MKINDIFQTIEGECGRAGELTIFIRLQGCNLRCSWCDTPESQERGKTDVYIEWIMSEIKALNPDCKNITITGGEPLLQSQLPVLCEKLAADNYAVEIETNGSREIWPVLAQIASEFRPAINFRMDIKCPSSGEADKNCWDNLPHLRPIDCVKFVVYDQADLCFAADSLKKIPVEIPIYISPVGDWKCGEILLHWLISMNAQYPGREIKIQKQLHKVLWPQEEAKKR